MPKSLFGKTKRSRLQRGTKTLANRVGTAGHAAADAEKLEASKSAGLAGKMLSGQLKKNKSAGMRPPR